jgi:hypothetical protein
MLPLGNHRMAGALMGKLFLALIALSLALVVGLLVFLAFHEKARHRPFSYDHHFHRITAMCCHLA